MRRRTAHRARTVTYLLVALLALASCAAGRVDARPGPAYPRTATYWLDQDRLPPVAELARYDLVVIDSEWANRVDRSMFDELRQRRPGIRILAYVNPVDYPPRLGSSGYYADRYALWQYRDSVTSTFPRQWLARTAAGQAVSQWPDTVMANLADTAPRVDGQTYAEYAARWVVDRVWSTGLWDGVFLDVWGDRIYGADRSGWDVDGDGSDEPDSEIYGADGPWERGVTRAEEIMREAMPGAVLVANGDRTLRDDLLDGRVFESFADPGSGRDPEADLERYVTTAAAPGHRTPGTAMTVNARRAVAGSAQELRNARFFLTATLLQDGYWAPMGSDYGELAFYDEMDGGGLGPGYLGSPVVADPSLERVQEPYSAGIGAVAPRVTRRDFARGIVLNNASAADVDVTLGGRFRHLTGRQDPAVNDGSTVTSVRLPAGDGLVLLRVDAGATG